MKLAVSSSVAVVAGFATQVVVGTLAFLIVLGAAVVVSAAVRALEEHHLGPPWLATSAGYVEMAIWGADLFVFALFMVVEAFKFARDLLGLGKQDD